MDFLVLRCFTMKVFGNIQPVMSSTWKIDNLKGIGPGRLHIHLKSLFHHYPKGSWLTKTENGSMAPKYYAEVIKTPQSSENMTVDA